MWRIAGRVVGNSLEDGVVDLGLVDLDAVVRVVAQFPDVPRIVAVVHPEPASGVVHLAERLRSLLELAQLLRVEPQPFTALFLEADLPVIQQSETEAMPPSG